MAKDVIVVEMRCVARLQCFDGTRRDVGPGEVAIARELIEPQMAVTRRITALDRAPTEEEIQLSAERALIPEGTSAGSADHEDDRALTELLKDHLVAGADHLGLDSSGTKAKLVARIEDEAQRLQVSTEGPGLAVIDAIKAAQETADA